MTKTPYNSGLPAFFTFIPSNNAFNTINYVQFQNLVKDQENIGLELLEKFNLGIIDVEDFDPKCSQVTMAIKPDSDPATWKPVTKTSKQYQTLVRDAATFDLKSESVETAFHGVLSVTLHANQNRSTFQKMLCYIGLKSRFRNIRENVALRVPPQLVSESFFFRILSRLILIYGSLLSLVISFVILLKHFMNLSLFVYFSE